MAMRCASDPTTQPAVPRPKRAECRWGWVPIRSSLRRVGAQPGDQCDDCHQPNACQRRPGCH
ncbi:hypothetical protein [Ornithinimicrobium kibberense]|uniref:hypothetical protein n=1 Tax=Ornithinimicrobium kibberense TaxID=282060 RepID=UPI00360AA04F